MRRRNAPENSLAGKLNAASIKCALTTGAGSARIPVAIDRNDIRMQRLALHLTQHKLLPRVMPKIAV
jgi:hypothetical protein